MDYKRMWNMLQICSQRVFSNDTKKDLFLVIAVIEAVEEYISDNETTAETIHF